MGLLKITIKEECTKMFEEFILQIVLEAFWYNN